MRRFPWHGIIHRSRTVLRVPLSGVSCRLSSAFGFSYRFLSPEFIPPRGRTDPLKFYMERRDMIQRRKVFSIPEFYVGSILAVTTADPYADGKTNRFVGICIQRGGRGLGATFVLRNVIEDQGVEICYELYSPRIQEITVLKLEKRLDDNLMYLRDALPEYSTFDMNMKPVPHLDHEEIPVNKVGLMACQWKDCVVNQRYLGI
uniref:Large ribosomal subunit protein bL19m n=1 Tax=Pavo cristatus TaxID=9049 RepID=A0A8C9FL82_PAVCR